MNQLPLIAARSLDPHTKLGCIITTSDHRPLSQGYNSFPAGANDAIPERFERPLKYTYIEHAERNAIYSAARHGIALQGGRIYGMALPCMDCARAVIQVGITEFVYDAARQAKWINPKYLQDFKLVIGFLQECGVSVTAWYPGQESA
jgi:dCMP deaminase